MGEIEAKKVSAEPGVDSKDSAFWRFAEHVYIWRKLVFIVTLVCFVLSVIIAFILPKEYKAVASILPSKKSSLFGLFASPLGRALKEFAPIAGVRVPVGEEYNYLAILNSRTAMERVVREFNLIKVYDIDDGSMEKAIKELRSNVDFELDDFGAIHIVVYDRDPIRAANMANFFVKVLKDINSRLSSEDARNIRIVIEKRYYQNLKDLEAAEDSLRVFQEKYGTVLLPEQAKASIIAAAELESRLIINEIKLGILEKQVSQYSPEIEMLKEEIRQLREKLKGFGSTGSSASQTVFLPFKEIPEKMKRYIDLYRNVELQAKLLEYLYPLYEQAKLEEAKVVSPVLVLDYAVPPEKKARPIRWLIVLSGIILGFVLSVLIAIFANSGLKIDYTNSVVKYKYHLISKRLVDIFKIKNEV